MMNTYRTGGDIHAATTSVIFNIPYAQAQDKHADNYKERRTIAKNVNFGTFYGLFPRGLQKTLKFKAGVEKSVEECQEIIANLKTGYPHWSHGRKKRRQMPTARCIPKQDSADADTSPVFVPRIGVRRVLQNAAV